MGIIWLPEFSNFHLRAVSFDGDWYRSNEHAFQATKTLDPDARRAIRLADTPGKAKRMGKEVELRPDWEYVKEQVMYDLCRQKFSLAPLDTLLLATQPDDIVEINTWHDNTWGDCTCPKCASTPGQNLLGKILMRIRDELRDDKLVKQPPPTLTPVKKAGTMRLCIAGSRTSAGKQWDDYAFLAAKVSALCAKITGPIIVLSGTARGADQLGERWAEQYSHPVEPWAADWVLYGNAATTLRNRRMLESATHAIFFWNGHDKDTANAINVAKELQIPHRVCMIPE